MASLETRVAAKNPKISQQIELLKYSMKPRCYLDERSKEALEITLVSRIRGIG